MPGEEDKPEKSSGCCSGWLDCDRKRSKKFIDDSKWEEVSYINDYALFMGYLSMGVRGLGFLVVTWTTVVLLGGFVSTIKQKDFWCLTVIVLTETAGVFDIFLKEKLSHIWHAVMGLLSASFATFAIVPGPTNDSKISATSKFKFVLGAIKACIQVLVLAFILSPLVVVYISGLYISTAISLWRLIQHDYGNTDENANMKPALDVLYSLAIVQGVVYGYRASYSPVKKTLVERIIKRYKFDCLGNALVWEYLEDTMSGCEKDPTFARGRNLITYAVDLMESNSPDSFLSGVRILDTILSRLILEEYERWWSSKVVQHTLIKHMIGSSSSSPVLQKLLQALDIRSPCNRETRRRAARIVKHLAGDIRLEEFPLGIQHISSLIGTFEEYSLIEPYQRDWLVEAKEDKWRSHAVQLSNFRVYKPIYKWHPDGFNNTMSISEGSYYGGDYWKGYKDLFLQGMRILRKLATDENNVSAMSHNQGLLSKIMAPITSDLLHHIDHDEWSSVVKGSLKVMRQLVSATGEAGVMMRRDISGNTQVISTLNRILWCNKCDIQIWELSMRILTRLYMDTQVTEDFVKLLLHRFFDLDHMRTVDEFTLRAVAGEALAMLSFASGSSAMIILQVYDDVGSSLRKVLLHREETRMEIDINAYRILAAQILEHLCIRYSKNGQCLEKLKEAMTDVIPKLLGEILPEEATQTQTGTGAGFSSSQADMEAQQANDLNKSAPAFKSVNSELREAFLSLCVTVCETFISADPDKARPVSEIHESSLPWKLRVMVEGTSQPMADNLRMLKLTSRMVISMVKHVGSSTFREQDLESLIQALSIASKSMIPVDGSISMYSASGDGEGDDTTATKPFRSLASLVEEAKEIVSKYKEGDSEIKELSTSADGEP